VAPLPCVDLRNVHALPFKIRRVFLVLFRGLYFLRYLLFCFRPLGDFRLPFINDPSVPALFDNLFPDVADGVAHALIKLLEKTFVRHVFQTSSERDIHSRLKNRQKRRWRGAKLKGLLGKLVHQKRISFIRSRSWSERGAKSSISCRLCPAALNVSFLMAALTPPDILVRMTLPWKQLDEICQKVVSDVVTVELVARKGSRTEAAYDLGISPAGLRSRLLVLQRNLGGPVLEKNCDFTPLGKAMSRLWGHLRPPVEQFIGEIAELKDQLQIRLCTIKSVWDTEHDWMEDEYATSVSGGNIRHEIADGFPKIEHRVRYGEADVGIVSFPPPEKDIAPPLKLQIWREEQMVFVADYFRTESRVSGVITPEELAGVHPTFFTMTEDASMYEPVNQYLIKNKIRFRKKISVDDAAEALKEVIAKNGVSILPQPFVENERKNGSIDVFLLKPPLKRPIGIIYREPGLKDDLVKAFVEVMMQNKTRPPHSGV
jgi:DNA-binding transcriptional LysR family regulator